jgi:hypothetical protein
MRTCGQSETPAYLLAERAQGVWINRLACTKRRDFSAKNASATDCADTFQRLTASVEWWRLE